MKTELQKQLEQAELEKIRAIDRVKELKAQIKEGEPQLSIYQFMPIGSVWLGCEVVEHDEDDVDAPIKTLHTLSGYGFWLEPKYLYELITEQRKLDAMERFAQAASFHCKNHVYNDERLYDAYVEYNLVVEQEDK